jgi:hypothetical protein
MMGYIFGARLSARAFPPQVSILPYVFRAMGLHLDEILSWCTGSHALLIVDGAGIWHGAKCLQAGAR